MNQSKFGHAIVIGRSMAGMTAARALIDHFEKVTIIDRDSHPASPRPRKGVPQGRHIHVLLQPGQEVLEGYFPGLLATLQKGGMRLVDSSLDLAWFHFGVWKKREQSSLPLVLCSRFFLEYHVRKQLSKIKGVKFQTRTTVEKLVYDESTSAVSGVVIRSEGSRKEKILKADLVVDASGRGSKIIRWLEELGYEKPPEERYGIDLAYTSAIFEPPKGFEENWKFLIHYPRPPHQRRAGFISAIEKGKWIVSLNGYFKDHAPTDEAGFLEFARSLPKSDIYQYLKRARRVSDITTFKIPETRRRYFEKLSRFPEGLVVVGDAIAVLNPIFGQGMTTASLGSKMLGEEVAKARSSGEGLQGLPLKFFRQIPAIVDFPWLVTTTEDMRYPETVGHRPLGLDLLNWYKAQMLELCSVNSGINQEFFKLVHLKNSLPNLLKPSVAIPVFLHGIKGFFTPLKARANTGPMPGLSNQNFSENKGDSKNKPAA